MSGGKASSDEENDDMNITADPGPAIDPAIQAAIGNALRAYCDDIVRAPIPDKFLLLLAQLEASENRAKEKSGHKQ